MKKVFLSITASLLTLTSFAQWTTNGNNVTIDKNIGIGTTTPSVKLDVNGDIKANVLHLRSINPGSSYVYSHIYYPGHSLIIGSPQGNWSINNIELKPGGTKLGAIYSTLSLFTSPNEGVHERKILFHTQGNSYFNGGYVGIGTDNPKKLLDVKGTIHAQNIEVDLNGWSDFVFDKDYKLPTLQEVEAHINEHNRLPDIPSEKQVKEEGINIGEMQAKLLQKIEELTLYVIELKKENNEIKHQLNNLQK